MKTAYYFFCNVLLCFKGWGRVGCSTLCVCVGGGGGGGGGVRGGSSGDEYLQDFSTVLCFSITLDAQLKNVIFFNSK